jgi:hypothetical protein
MQETANGRTVFPPEGSGIESKVQVLPFQRISSGFSLPLSPTAVHAVEEVQETSAREDPPSVFAIVWVLHSVPFQRRAIVLVSCSIGSTSSAPTAVHAVEEVQETP